MNVHTVIPLRVPDKTNVSDLQFDSFLALCRCNKKCTRDDVRFCFFCFLNLPTINFNNFSVQPNAQFFLIKLPFILVFSYDTAIDLPGHVYEE